MTKRQAMQLTVRDIEGKSTSRVKVDDSVFKIEPNADVVYRAVVAEMAASRRGSRSTKTRGETRGSGRKPWRQKGLGRARVGSVRSPLWRGGGVAFGPKPATYRNRLPKKMRRLARRSVLSQRVKDKEIVVVDTLGLEKPRTRSIVTILKNLGLEEKKVTFLPGELDRNVVLSARNLPNVTVIPAVHASTRDLLDCQVLLFDRKGIKELSNQLAGNS
ncbi:MAG: 50S ribosomal protein L4 [Fidelibacterota bacterium]